MATRANVIIKGRETGYHFPSDGGLKNEITQLLKEIYRKAVKYAAVFGITKAEALDNMLLIETNEGWLRDSLDDHPSYTYIIEPETGEIEYKGFIKESDNRFNTETCPECGAVLNYGVFEVIESGEGFYPISCPRCEFEGKEYYKLVYAGMEDEDGNEVERPSNSYLELMMFMLKNMMEER